MGKKTDTKQMLQVGKKNNKYIWDSKYFEKQSKESQIYLFQSLEIKKFLKKFFNNYELNISKFNINFSESSLKIFISYFKTSEIKNIISKINTNYKLKLVRKRKILKKYLYKSSIYRKNKKKAFKKNKNLKKNIFYTFYNFYNAYIKQKVFIKKKKANFQSFYSIYKLKNLLEKKKLLSKFNYFLLKKCINSSQNFNKIKF